MKINRLYSRRANREYRDQFMNKPDKVKNCMTHHHAYECREWQSNNMKEALEKIKVLHTPPIGRNVYASKVLEICNEGLGLKS